MGIQVTPEQHARLVKAVRECREDPAEFFRRFVKINAAGKLIPFELDPVKRPAQWLVHQAEVRAREGGKSPRLIILKGRQGGITTHGVLTNFHLVWAHSYCNVATFLHNDTKAGEVFEIARIARDHFPKHLLPALGRAEKMELSFPARHSTFRMGTGGSVNSGRSVPLQRATVSEWAHIEQLKEFLSGLEPALNSVRGSSLILETTASSYGSYAHELWNISASGKGLYTALFLPWWLCQPENYRETLEAPDELGRLEEDELALVERHGLDLEQIKWRRKQRQGAGGPTLFLREYAEDPESCWIVGGTPYFDTDTLRVLHTRAPTPFSPQRGNEPAIYPENGSIDLASGERVIIGCDPAHGIDGDRTAWIARALPSWRPIASFASNRIDPDDVAVQLETWGRRLGNALIVVESNIPTVVNRLGKSSYPTRLIYHQQQIKADHSRAGQTLGFNTSSASKPFLLDLLVTYFKEAAAGLCHGPIVETVADAFGTHRNKRGGIDTNGRDFLIAEGLARLGLEAPRLDSAFGLD